LRVLIVEDDKLLAESLKDYLVLNGFEVDCRQVIDDLDLIHRFDILLLDLMLKEKKGESILRELRKKEMEIPVIIITAKSDIESKEICFQYGADDYIVKPFEPKELLMRINALLRRVYCCDTLQIDNVVIDFKNKTVLVNGSEVFFSRIEWDLLCVLARNRGKMVSIDKILSYVWGDRAVGSESVRTYIKNLRKVLPEDFIITYKGRGYRLK